MILNKNYPLDFTNLPKFIETTKFQINYTIDSATKVQQNKG